MFTDSPAHRTHLRHLQNERDAQHLRALKQLCLYNEKTFYRAFIKDLSAARKEVIIYSPFATKFRSEFFRQAFADLRHRNVCVFIFTRPPEEYDLAARAEVELALQDYEEWGACVYRLPGHIHAKIALVDREIAWDGSLNILSQRASKELMRRTCDEDVARQLLTNLGLVRKVAEGYKYQYERLYRNLLANSRHQPITEAWVFFAATVVPAAVRAGCNGTRFMLRLARTAVLKLGADYHATNKRSTDD